MSLVRPPDMSNASYRYHNTCSLKGGEDSSVLPTSKLYAMDKHTFYTGDSFSPESDDPMYFIDSSSEEPVHPSSSGANSQFDDSPFTAIDKNHYHPPNFKCDSLETQSPETVGFETENIRLKLQELEHALLDDANEVEDFDYGSYQSMGVDQQEWAQPRQDLMLHDSPKESSSSMDSNMSSSISSNKEVYLPLSKAQALKQLLFNCARSISEENFDEASTMITELRQMVSMQGEPSERIAAYMVEGLAARLAASGKILYKALKCKEPPTSDRLAAMQILFEGCPCFKFGFMTANGAIIELIRGLKRAHIVDFDINQGNQYITLIQSLSNLPRNKLPQIKLTGVDDPESVQRAVGGLKNIGQRLEKLAEALGVPFEFEAIPSKISDLRPDMLRRDPGGDDALIVNFAFQLHHMPDESVSTMNQRDQLLRMVKGLNPKLVTVVEQDVNTNTTPFLARFTEAYNYYSAVFESLDVTFTRESQDRVNVEKQCLARDIVNIIACEGEDRIERYEVAGKWRARMSMAGFSSCPISQNVKGAVQTLMKQYSDRYKLVEDRGLLGFGWDDKNLIVVSSWN